MAGASVQPVTGSVYAYATVIVPLKPVGSNEAVPSILSVTPVPDHVPPASVGVPVRVMAEASSHNGPYGPPASITGAGFTVIFVVAGVFVHIVTGSVYE